MTAERRSSVTTAGDRRAPNRSMMRAMGFQDRDFDKPLVGLASGHSTVTPCNMGLGELAEKADAALRDAGVMPELFGTTGKAFSVPYSLEQGQVGVGIVARWKEPLVVGRRRDVG